MGSAGLRELEQFVFLVSGSEFKATSDESFDVGLQGAPVVQGVGEFVVDSVTVGYLVAVIVEQRV